MKNGWDLNLIRLARLTFGNAVGGFVIKGSTIEPRLLVAIHMMVFEYFVIQASIEGEGVYFALVLPGYQVPLLECPLKEGAIAHSMASLADELRLRIPDKYLEAKGWGSGKTS